MTNYSVPNSFYLQILSISFEDVPLLERENDCFFFTCVVWSTVHHTALKNHRMYILLQQSLNLIFDITKIIIFIYFMSQPNVSYFHKNFYMNTHSQQKRKFPTRRKAGVLLFMNNVHIIINNTSISYLNGFIIMIILFQ